MSTQRTSVDSEDNGAVGRGGGADFHKSDTIYEITRPRPIGVRGILINVRNIRSNKCYAIYDAGFIPWIYSFYVYYIINRGLQKSKKK